MTASPPPDRPHSSDSAPVPSLPGDVPSAAGLTLLLCRDQQQRWRNGERPRVEDYLARHPHLGVNTDCILQLLCGEFLLRQECGQTPAIEEYRERFPNHVDALRCHLEHLAQLAAEVLAPTPRAGPFTSPEALMSRRHGCLPCHCPWRHPDPRSQLWRCPATRCSRCSARAAWVSSTVPASSA
jgi:hypothetical protein